MQCLWIVKCPTGYVHVNIKVERSINVRREIELRVQCVIGNERAAFSFSGRRRGHFSGANAPPSPVDGGVALFTGPEGGVAAIRALSTRSLISTVYINPGAVASSSYSSQQQVKGINLIRNGSQYEESFNQRPGRPDLCPHSGRERAQCHLR